MECVFEKINRDNRKYRDFFRRKAEIYREKNTEIFAENKSFIAL
jgi:hypothetical protein